MVLKSLKTDTPVVDFAWLFYKQTDGQTEPLKLPLLLTWEVIKGKLGNIYGFEPVLIASIKMMNDWSTTCHSCKVYVSVSMEKNAYALKTPHVVSVQSYSSVSSFASQSMKASLNFESLSIERPIENIFWPRDLDLWPMTLTYKLDLDILPLDLRAKNQDCLFVRSPTRVVTDTHTHTNDVETITPITSETWGVIISTCHTGCNVWVS